LKNKLFISILILLGGISIGVSYAVTTDLASGNDAAIDPAKKLFFDEVAGTYITSPGGTIMDFVVSDLIAIRAEESGGAIKIIMPSTQRLYLDGGASSYIFSPGASIMDFIVGDSIAMRSEKSGGVVKTIMPSTQRLYLDGGASSYIFSPGASIIDFVVGDTLAIRNEKSGGLVNTILPQTNKLFFDGGANSYIHSPGFATIDIFSGNTKTLTANNGLVGIGTGTPLEILDVAGNIRLTGNIVSPNDICIGTCP